MLWIALSAAVLALLYALSRPVRCLLCRQPIIAGDEPIRHCRQCGGTCNRVEPSRRRWPGWVLVALGALALLYMVAPARPCLDHPPFFLQGTAADCTMRE